MMCCSCAPHVAAAVTVAAAAAGVWGCWAWLVGRPLAAAAAAGNGSLREMSTAGAGAQLDARFAI